MNILSKTFKNKELLWTVLYQLVTLVSGLLLIKLLSKILSLDMYGYYVLLTSIVAFIVMFPFSAWMQGISRLNSKYRNNYEAFITSIILVNLVLIIFYFIVAIIVKSTIEISVFWGELYYFIATYIVTEIFKILFRTISNSNRQRKSIALSVLMENTVKLTIIALLGYYKILSMDYLLLVLILANVISIITLYKDYYIYFQIRKLNFKAVKVIFIKISLFSNPLVLWAVFGWFRDMSNRWYLDYYLDKEHVALFAMMASIAMIAPTALQNVVGGFFLPILYQKDNEDKKYVRKFILKSQPILFLFLMSSVIVTFIFKEEIILIISSENYLEVAWMLPWMYLVFCIYTLSMMATYEIFAHGQTKKLLISTIIPGLLSVVFGYFLIGKYGVIGALYNYALTYLSYALLTFYAVAQYSTEFSRNIK